ncbi:Uncharacterized protein Rs2_27427 [Raphanus sativus]|nr:Uncharacterized protein Rs2_27427 [Raphanus sativus]
MEMNSNKPPLFLPKRSQSVNSRHPSPYPATEMSAATKMLITSTRSLSVSFQGEAFSLPSSKKKEAAAAPPVIFSGEKPVKCMAINLRTAPQRYLKANQVTFAKAETETGQTRSLTIPPMIVQSFC